MKDISWFKNYRMEWIKECLRVYGFINRAHIMRKFEFSGPQASADISLFQKLYPGMMKYNLPEKKYEAIEPPEGCGNDK